jgi:hypothetical protein
MNLENIDTRKNLNCEKKDYLDGVVTIIEYTSDLSNGYLINIYESPGGERVAIFAFDSKDSSRYSIEEIKSFIETLAHYEYQLAVTSLVDYLRKLGMYEQDSYTQMELNTPLIERRLLAHDLLVARQGTENHTLTHADLNDEIRLIMLHSFQEGDLLEQLENEFRVAQVNDLFLIDNCEDEAAAACYRPDGTLSYELLKERNLVKHTTLSMLPLVLAEEQESKLREMVRSVSIAKISILRHAAENTDLQSLLIDGLSDVSKEVTVANFARVTENMRLRYDTFSSMKPGPISAFELNGNEPQGDVANSRNYIIVQEHISRFLRYLGASDTDIQYCFANMTTPVNAVGEAILDIYSKNASSYPELPSMPTIGFMAFKNAKTGAPYSKISNIEAQQSRLLFKKIPGLDDSVSFDPFDIVDFKALSGSGNYIIPIVKIPDDKGGELFKEVHFIRRLSGSLLSAGNTTWLALKKNKPEIYYKFIGLKHEEHNPLGQSIPGWMWMNPLVPSLTDKRLDSILTDPRLLHRFKVKEKLQEYLIKNQLISGTKTADEMADDILEACAKYIPKTRILSLNGVTGLHKTDTNFSASLTQKEIDEIKANRFKYVIKQNALTGSSGVGVFLGPSLDLQEIPRKIFNLITPEQLDSIKQEMLMCDRNMVEVLEMPLDDVRKMLRKNRHIRELISFNLYNILWGHLVDFSIQQGQTIIQELSKTHTHRVMPMSVDVKTDQFNLTHYANGIIDINPQAIGTKLTGIHSRYVQVSEENVGKRAKGKGNITGDSLGVGRNVVLPSVVASRIVALYREITKLNGLNTPNL